MSVPPRTMIRASVPRAIPPQNAGLDEMSITVPDSIALRIVETPRSSAMEFSGRRRLYQTLGKA
jgi:hypothetical protein